MRSHWLRIVIDTGALALDVDDSQLHQRVWFLTCSDSKVYTYMFLPLKQILRFKHWDSTIEKRQTFVHAQKACEHLKDVSTKEN